MAGAGRCGLWREAIAAMGIGRQRDSNVLRVFQGMTSSADPVDASFGSSLCTRCGLCCTGALHDFAVLDPDEIDYARSIGMTLRTEGRPGFALPCPKLSGSCCSIYVDRPKVCSRFQCALLEQFEAGSIEVQAATAIVAEARQLFDGVFSRLPDGTTIPEARAMNKTPPTANADSVDRSSEMRLRLAITALSLFLDQHFRKSSEGTLLSLETIADDRSEREMR